jgi:hypothetical protein
MPLSARRCATALALLAAISTAVADAADDGIDHSGHAGMPHAMPGFLGDHAMSREASGTTWQPESTPHGGTMIMGATWDWMLHAFVQTVYTDQGGPRGDSGVYTPMMFMAMGSRELGAGRLGLRAMLSPEAVQMGAEGYPLLLQTGETADGVTHLIDRQHPHDLFMELAATYSRPLGADARGFLYLGLPGEPALGPPVFMHRYSGIEFPAAPISHHWLDSTHITFGVVTAGVIRGAFKFEGSAFHGREPDSERYDIETGALDSWSARATWNPDADWSLQLSHGEIVSPEALEPTVDVARTTASALYATDALGGYSQTTLAWGRNVQEGPGHYADLYAWLLESAWSPHADDTVLFRFEHALKNEMFNAGDPGGDPHDEFHVNSLSLGWVHELAEFAGGSLGAGLLWTKSLVPSELEDDYGGDPESWTLFLRWRL